MKIVALLAMLCGVLMGCRPTPVATQPARPLNVLFIAVDDLRPELNCYGAKGMISPAIDALAARGVLFDRAYCQQAICAPSRASLLTGFRPDSAGVDDLSTSVRKKNPEVVTLPQLFKNNGYWAVSLGKIFHNSAACRDPESWSEAAWNPRGDWGPRGYLLPENIAIAQVTKGGNGPAWENADVPDSAYHDGKVALEAIRLLAVAKEKQQPFFLAVGFDKPHLPFNAPKRYWDLYQHRTFNLPEPTAASPDLPAFVLSQFGELRPYQHIPAKGPVPDSVAQKLLHGYAACVSYMDAQVGKVLHALDSLGLADNTVVVLWGDHGFKLGECSEWCKHTNFEVDNRVPLIIAAPGMDNARKETRLAELIDLYPTLAELAGLNAPVGLQGRSLVPLLLGEKAPDWKTAVYHQFMEWDKDKIGYSVKTDAFRYNKWYDLQNGFQVIAEELYDQQRDPLETVNLAHRPEYAAQKREMEKLLNQENQLIKRYGR